MSLPVSGRHQPRRRGSPSGVGEIVAGSWLVVGTAAAVGGLGSTNRDARVLVVAAAGVAGVACAVALVLFCRHTSAGLAAALLIVAGLLMPTFAWAAINLVPIVTGTTLLVVERRRSRPGTPRR